METTEQTEENAPGLLAQAKAIAATGLAALHNRTELFLLELEEERARVIELVVWGLAIGFLGMMFLGLLTALVIMLCPAAYQMWAVGGFCVLYLVGAIAAFLNLKSLLNSGPPPFAGSMNEMKKDRDWFDSLK